MELGMGLKGIALWKMVLAYLLGTQIGLCILDLFRPNIKASDFSFDLHVDTRLRSCSMCTFH